MAKKSADQKSGPVQLTTIQEATKHPDTMVPTEQEQEPTTEPTFWEMASKAILAMNNSVLRDAAQGMLASWMEADEVLRELIPQLDAFRVIQDKASKAQTTRDQVQAGLEGLLCLQKSKSKAPKAPSEIKDRALERFLGIFRALPPIFGYAEVESIVGSKNTATSTIDRAKKGGVIELVERGKYRLTDAHR